jgi:hypothetical protein
LFQFSLASNVSATASFLTLSITDTVDVTLFPTPNGTFATSSTTTPNISIITNNATGYTLSIKATANNNNALINVSDPSETIPSITAPVSEANYRDNAYALSHNLNNTYGYRPSKLNSVDNSDYLPTPISSANGTVLDKTTVPNPSVANTYNIAIGARVDMDTSPGSYANTFVITVVANPSVYSISYNANGGSDTVTNMPTNVVNQETFYESTDISSTVPVRDNYAFKGWCTNQMANGASCTGTTYNPDGGGTDLTWTIDQTIPSNSLLLYAMWEQAGPCKPNGSTINAIVCLQDITGSNKTSIVSSMIQNTQYKLIDVRDEKEYTIAKLADGNIWMTQNLDLDISSSKTYTPADTDILSNWRPNTSTYSTGTSTWSNTSITPESYDPGDLCWNGTIDNSWSGTLNNKTAVCGSDKHYHVGNYYNWTAAVAMNDSSGYTTLGQNVNQSICPAGWRLPTSQIYANLISSLSLTVGITGNIQKTPVYFVYGGIWNGSSRYVGSDGRVWTPEVSLNITNNARILYFAVDDELYAGSNTWKASGTPMRCVVR